VLARALFLAVSNERQIGAENLHATKKLFELRQSAPSVLGRCDQSLPDTLDGLNTRLGHARILYGPERSIPEVVNGLYGAARGAAPALRLRID
jgi:hypothetical protein